MDDLVLFLAWHAQRIQCSGCQCLPFQWFASECRFSAHLLHLFFFILLTPSVRVVILLQVFLMSS